ncbi:MAG: molybdenum cofactor cytidylyltransferase [Desulfuromonadales bacterium]
MNGHSNIVGIILAAGEGSRMGAIKQMLPFNGKTILQRVVDNAITSSLQSVVVVVGHCADLIVPTLNGNTVTVVINGAYKSGQCSSIKAGMGTVPEGVDAVLFILGDQPLVTPDTINLLLNAYRTSGAPIVLPTFNGIRGNPVLFSRETFRRLELLDCDSGARPLFDEYPGRILQVPVDDCSIQFDIDTEEDYRRLCEFELEQDSKIRM